MNCHRVIQDARLWATGQRCPPTFNSFAILATWVQRSTGAGHMPRTEGVR